MKSSKTNLKVIQLKQPKIVKRIVEITQIKLDFELKLIKLEKI